MDRQFNSEVSSKIKKQRGRRAWKRVLGVLMCLVVFCTTYVLILPAITKETNTFCGLEEHSHSDACYGDVLICGEHVHGEGCYAAPAELFCTESVEPLHTHGESCYETRQELICTESTEPLHVHGQWCYNEHPALVCTEPESETHTHGEACMGTELTLICTESTEPAHVHGETCYGTVRELVCTESDAPAHVHGEGCFGPQQLSCTLEDNPGHVHTEDCTEIQMICGKEIHVHSQICYSDPSADVETESDWTASLPELTGYYGQDVAAIALSQLGYAESQLNYDVTEDGELLGYTRYGAWYGDPYGNWDAMFASFCYYYAGVTEMPLGADSAAWAAQLRQAGMFRTPSDHVPAAGDLIFLDRDQDGAVDRVAVVEKLEDLNATVIAGNSDNQVERSSFDLFDSSIVGYGVFAVETVPETADPEETPDSDGDSGPVYTGTGAWAELITPEETAEIPAEPAVSTYSLRRSASTYAARAGTPLDLTPYINSVNMYDSSGNLLPSGSLVSEGDIIEFKIEYTIAGQQLGVMNGENVTVYSDTLTYAIPKTFQIVRDDSGSILNSSGMIVGTYLIDSTTGLITMEFNEEYVKQNANGQQIQGNISFFSTVTKITDEDGEKQDYKFTDDISLGIYIKEKEGVVGDLSIEKEVASVNGEELTYVIKVTSVEGTNGPITIRDEMSKGLTFKEGVSVKKGNTNVNATFIPASDRRSFTLTLPEMKAGESYTVTYKCNADIDLLDANMTVSNTATVNGKDSEDFDLEDEVTVDHRFDVLEKTGVKNEDGSITWTITINRAKVDISGWELVDIIRVNNTSTSYTGPVTIRDSRGYAVASNVRLPYTFPNGSTDTYTVTYTTTHDFGNVYNSAILRDEDTEINENYGVVVGSPFTKTGEAGELIQDEAGNYLLPITWTVTIDATNAAITGGMYFEDIMEGWPSDDMYMTYDQLMTALDNFDKELSRVAGQEVEGLTAWAYAPGTGNNGKEYNIFDLRANVDNCQSLTFDKFTIMLGNKGIPKGNVVTVEYEAYGVFPDNLVSTTRYVNRFNLAGQYEVEGRVDYTVGAIKATKYAMKPYDPVVNGNDIWFWGLTDWTPEGTTQVKYEDLKDSYLAWAIELSVPPGYTNPDDMIIYEDLPEGVSIKSLKLPFFSGRPIEYVSFDNMEPGNTYTWDFTLYPADQYGQYRPQGGQPTSIIFKVTEQGDLEITLPGSLLRVMGDLAKLNNSEEWYGYLYIFTQINDDFKWTPREEGSLVYVNSFENRFTITDEDGILIDIGSQTQRVTKDESSGVIRKKGTMDGNNIITYSVVLNAYGRDLIEHSGTLNIHDELIYTSTDAVPLRLRLVPGSVKLYEIELKSDGSYTKLGAVSAGYNYAETSSEQNGTTTWSHVIDMVIPDGKALLLEYSYRASGDKNAAHEVNNTCTISGVGQGSIDGEHKVEIEVKDATAQADIRGVMIHKVDASNNGIFLENARFNIYIWNAEQNKYIIVHHPENGGTDFTTDANGMIVLDTTTMKEEQFAYNTAYYMVEVESPEGYYVSPERYYFYIEHEDKVAYVPNIPSGFKGTALTSGDIIYRDNVSQYTEITIEKYWRDYDGNYVTVTGSQVPGITLELWQMLEGEPNTAKVYGTYTIIPDEDGNWSLTVRGLPRALRNEEGTKGKDFLYYIKEAPTGNYALESSENNGGINSGIIKLVNRELDGYVLPETGGAGTKMYTVAGAGLISIGTACLLYRAIKRRKEGKRSS